jgi:hypothetical protein
MTSHSTGSNYPAAEYCSNLVFGGYSDWYLPARDELTLLYTNRVAIGGFNTSGVWNAGNYWSSQETYASGVRTIEFQGGWSCGDCGKSPLYSVRCVR